MVEAAKTAGKDPTAYYLAFYRGNDRSKPQGNVTITVTAQDKNDVYYMNGNADLDKPFCTAENENIAFEMKAEGYYLLVKTEKAPDDGKTPDDSKTPDGSTPDDGKTPSNVSPDGSPKTGDCSDLGLGICLIFVIASAAALAVVLKKHFEKA